MHAGRLAAPPQHPPADWLCICICQLYLMTNKKVRNMKKYRREICYAPPQRPPSDWLCPTADNSVSSQQTRVGIREIIWIFSSDQLYFSVSVNHISKPWTEMTIQSEVRQATGNIQDIVKALRGRLLSLNLAVWHSSLLFQPNSFLAVSSLLRQRISF